MVLGPEKLHFSNFLLWPHILFPTIRISVESLTSNKSYGITSQILIYIYYLNAFIKFTKYFNFLALLLGYLEGLLLFGFFVFVCVCVCVCAHALAFGRNFTSWHFWSIVAITTYIYPASNSLMCRALWNHSSAVREKRKQLFFRERMSKGKRKKKGRREREKRRMCTVTKQNKSPNTCSLLEHICVWLPENSQSPSEAMSQPWGWHLLLG